MFHVWGFPWQILRGISAASQSRGTTVFSLWLIDIILCLSWRWSWKIYPLIFFFPYTLSNRMKQYLTSFPSFPTLHSPENEGRVEGQVHPQQNAKENTGPGSAEAARAAEFSVAEGQCNGLKEPESIQKTTWQSGTRGPRERGWASDSGTNWKLKEWETLRDCLLFVRCFRGQLRLQT